MTRRDTIVVAVLINVALLGILFMMAVNTSDEKISEQPGESQIVLQTPEPVPIQLALTPEQSTPMGTLQEAPAVVASPTLASSGDELDNVLKDYAANVPPQTLVMDDDNPDMIEKDIPVEQPAQTPQSEETPKAPKVASPSSTVKLVDVTVKKGDSLDKIARANGTTIDAIRKANGLTKDTLKIGQVLKVPVGSKKTSSSATASAPVKKPAQTTEIASNDPVYYVVKSGDNPWKIAKQYKVSYEDILKLNNLDEEKARNLKVGDKIRVK